MDMEKVIKCLEACTGDSGDCAGHTCPYWDFDDDMGCRTQMELDALALLKEQDAFEQKQIFVKEGHSKIVQIICPCCGKKIGCDISVDTEGR